MCSSQKYELLTNLFVCLDKWNSSGGRQETSNERTTQKFFRSDFT